MKTIKNFFYGIFILLISSCTTDDISTNLLQQNNLDAYLDTLGFTKISSSSSKDEFLKLTNSMNFKSNSEAIDFFKNFENPIDELDISIEPTKSKTIALKSSTSLYPCRKRITLSNIYGLGTRFSVGYTANLSDGNIASDISNIDITMTGNTLGVSFDETYSSAYVSGDGTVNTYSEGIINYNLFAEGIGTVWRSRVVIRTSYKPNPCGGNGSEYGRMKLEYANRI